jgi:hypothetical protein
MSAFCAGTIVEITKTDNVIARFPELIGTLGKIESVPCHPSTWYSVKVVDDHRLVKLQTTAMKIVPKSRLPSATASVKTSLTSKNLAAIAPPAAAPSYNRPRSYSNVSCGISMYTRGVSVKILGTENVMQRVPHLVGCVGTIREVPVHPTTWFKIEFPGGNIVTFRPSAFKLADGSQDMDEDELIAPPKKSARSPAVYVEEDESDLSVGCTVRIREGRFSGMNGEVLRLGNGWVQVLTDQGEVSKRSHELELAGGRPAHPRPRAGSLTTAPAPGLSLNLGLQDEAVKRSKSGRAVRSHSVYSLSGDTDTAADRPRKQARTMTTFLIQTTDDGRVTAKKTVTEVSPGARGRAKPTAAVSPTTVPSGPAISFLYDLERQELDCPFPLKSLENRQAKRARLQAYVDRETDAVLGRPNLSLWLDRLHHSLCAEGAPEPLASRRTDEETAPALAATATETAGSPVFSLTAAASAAMAAALSDPSYPASQYPSSQYPSQYHLSGLASAHGSESDLSECPRAVHTGAYTGSGKDSYEGSEGVSDGLSEMATGRGSTDTMSGSMSDSMSHSMSDFVSVSDPPSAAVALSHMARVFASAAMSAIALSETTASGRSAPAGAPVHAPHATTATATATAAATHRPRRFTRSDSMAAETDNEDAFSPELTGIAYDPCHDRPDRRQSEGCSPPPLMLPPSVGPGRAFGDRGEGGLASAFRPFSGTMSAPVSLPIPKDFSEWTQLVSADGTAPATTATTTTGATAGATGENPLVYDRFAASYATAGTGMGMGYPRAIAVASSGGGIQCQGATRRRPSFCSLADGFA